MQIADDLLGIHPRFHRISESRTIYLRLTDFFRRFLASIIVNRLSIRGSAIGARTRACSASEHPSKTHMPTLKIVIITNAENIRRAAVDERQPVGLCSWSHRGSRSSSDLSELSG
ncbi:MAG TPA: hypothetical protein EYN72_07590 [Dehalococcoidia bacterium]|nr:hypothetical protein [Dehalococcoidia bacterium]